MEDSKGILKESGNNNSEIYPEIIKEHILFWPVAALYVGSAYIGTTGYGLVVAGIVGSVMSIPIGMYGRKAFRYLPNVRYRIGKYQATGDGGEDRWTVILRKKMANFFTHPFTHVFKPAPGLEFTVDCAGACCGSTRLGEKPMTVIGSHERFIHPIGDNDVAWPGIRDKLTKLEKLITNSKLDMQFCITNDVQYNQLHDFYRNTLTEDQYYRYMGYLILQRDGLVIPTE